MDTNILITIIQVLGTIVVAMFTYFTNHKIQKISEVKEELRNELKAQHEETIKLIEEVKVENDMNNVDSIRNRLVAFEQLCRLDVNNDSIKKWQYDNAFKDEDKWHEYHEKYPHINGIIDMAIENIHEHYKKAKF